MKKAYRRVKYNLKRNQAKKFFIPEIPFFNSSYERYLTQRTGFIQFQPCDLRWYDPPLFFVFEQAHREHEREQIKKDNRNKKQNVKSIGNTI